MTALASTPVLCRDGARPPGALRNTLAIAHRELREADDSDRIRTALDALTTSMQRIGEAVYGQAGAASSGDGAGFDSGAPEGEPGESTVEGEFREV